MSKIINVSKCEYCPFISWEVDFDQDYCGAQCMLAYNLKLDPPMTYGGNLISIGCDSEDKVPIKRPEWCPLKNENYKIKYKL